MENYTGMLVIHGDLFQYDHLQNVLINHQKPLNRYPLGHLEVTSDGFKGYYNPITKEMLSTKDIPVGMTKEGLYIPFCIPKEMLTEEFRNSDYLIQKLNKECIKQKWNFQYVSEELSGRFNGTYAEMKIDGIRYLVDLPKMEIRQTDHPERKFIFPPKALYHPTELYYNTQTKLPVIFSERINEYPEHVICFVFPKLNAVDPIGYCLLNGYPPSWLVSTCQWNPKSMNVPWKGLSQTPIPELVRRNQIEQELQDRKSTSKKPSIKL